MWIALDIVFVYTYRIHLFTRIIQFLTEKDRKKKYRQMARFIFFFSFVEKKKRSSPVHRSWGKIVQWKSKRIRDVFTLSGTRFCYSVGRKVGAAEEAGSKLHKCESFRAKVVRKYGPIVTRISEISPCCFSLFFSNRKIFIN